MYNWSTDEEQFRKDFPQDFQKWRILQLINYGLDGQKLDSTLLKKLWPEIKNKENDKWIKRYIETIILRKCPKVF